MERKRNETELGAVLILCRSLDRTCLTSFASVRHHSREEVARVQVCGTSSRSPVTDLSTKQNMQMRI